MKGEGDRGREEGLEEKEARIWLTEDWRTI